MIRGKSTVIRGKSTMIRGKSTMITTNYLAMTYIYIYIYIFQSIDIFVLTISGRILLKPNCKT